MSQSSVTVAQLFRQDVWRWMLTVIIVVAPLYGFALLYYLATGDYQQPLQRVLAAGNMNLGTMLATLFLPTIAAVWVLGFRGWPWLVMTVVAFILTSFLPSSIASQLLPGAYLRLAVTLLVVTLVYQLARYGYQRQYEESVERLYTRGALAIIILTVIVGSVLLLPISLSL